MNFVMRAFYLLVAIGTLSACYSNTTSLTRNSDLASPLPKTFLAHSPTAMSKLYTGELRGSTYNITSHASIRSAKFTPLPGLPNSYWLESKNYDAKKGTTSYISIAVTIRGNKLIHHNIAVGAPQSSRSALIAELSKDVRGENKTTPTEFTIYDLSNAADRAIALKIIKEVQDAEAKKKQNKAQAKAKVSRDFSRNKWNAATSAVKSAVKAQAPIDDGVPYSTNWKVETQPLVFYKNTQLVRVTGDWKPTNLQFFYLWNGSKLTRLNGTSPAIHTFNKTGRLNITKDTVGHYLAFFGFFVRGSADASPFLLVETTKDTYLPKGNTKQGAVNRAVKPTTCKQSGAKFNCSGVVYYGNAVFGAEFAVETTGMVQMLSDDPKVADLNKKVDAPITVAAVGSRLALGKPTTSKAKPNTAMVGRWFFEEKKDPFDNSTKQYLYGFPDGYDDLKTSPYIRIGCYGRNDEYPMGITFNWRTRLSKLFPDGQHNMVRITSKFGDGETIELGWAASDDMTSAFPPSDGLAAIAQMTGGITGAFAPNSAVAKTKFGWKVKDFHFNLMANEKAVFRAYARSGDNPTLFFNTNGYAEQAARFADHCNRN